MGGTQLLETTLRVANSSNVGTTGLTGAEIKFRRSPFGSGDEITIAGVSGGTNGIYLCSHIGVTYQAAQLWISGIYQATWGTKYIGDLPAYLVATYLAKAGGTMLGNIAMGGNKATGAGAATANGQYTVYEQVGLLAGANTWTGSNSFNNIPRNSTSRSYGGNVYELVDVKYLTDNYGTGTGTNVGVNVNRLIVDSKQTTDVAGKIFNGIQEAITYAGTQTPSSTSRWLIIIMPHHSSGYAEDITLLKYVDLVGWGNVYITGGFTTSHVTGSETWSARDARIENLVFNSTDKNYRFRLLHIKNCIAKANGAAGEIVFYIDGSNCNNFGIFTQNDVDLQANATEQENRVFNCFGNEEPVWESGDDVGSFTLLNSVYEF